MTGPFEVAWVLQVPFGTLAAVTLPPGREPVEAAVLERLHPRERALAESERARRQIEIVGGRLAFHAATGLPDPLLPDSNRAPIAPPGWCVSLSHKEDLALALVAPSTQGLIGVDLEGGERDRSSIASRVCRPEELALVEQLPPAERWPSVMVRFAVKEAIYKALAPRLGRFFGFQCARVDVLSRDRVSATMFLEPTDPLFDVEVELLWLEPAQLVAMVRAHAR